MGDFFQISTSSISFLLASIGTLIDNAMPVVLPLLGLIIGFWIFESFLNIGKMEKRYKQRRELLINTQDIYEPESLEPEELEELEEIED